MKAQRFTNPSFRAAVKELLTEYSHYDLAAILRKRGVSFTDAYTAIFGRPPKLADQDVDLDLDFAKAAAMIPAMAAVV